MPHFLLQRRKSMLSAWTALGVIVSAAATAETSPSAEEVSQALNTTKELVMHGDYEGALQDMLWYWEASKTVPAQSGVRLSFALSTWTELGEKYPKAKSALLEIRDADEAAIGATGGTFDTFNEYDAINRELDDEDRTYTQYKDLVEKHPKKAQAYFPAVETLLVEKRDYALCNRYLTDPELAIDQIVMMRKMELRAADMPQLAGNKEFILHQADHGFEDRTRELILILIGGGREDEAAAVQGQAAKQLNSTRIRSAIQDAKASVSAQ